MITLAVTNFDLLKESIFFAALFLYAFHLTVKSDVSEKTPEP
jgi:hypothetical protein